jgi:hypothetical protein
MPARKIGREWKFSRRALIEWVGSGRSREFYREGNHAEEDVEITPARPERSPERATERGPGEKSRGRRTAGWAIELD